MQLIKELYAGLDCDQRLQREDKEVEQEIRKMEERIKDNAIIGKDEMSDLFYEASSYGHSAGFALGFRCAMMLMVECFL